MHPRSSRIRPAARRAPRPWIPAALLSCLAACQGPGPQNREVEVVGYTGAQVWQGVVDFAESRGFKTDEAGTDIGDKVYQTRWIGEAVSFRRSSRRRFKAMLSEMDRKQLKWLVEFHVEEQGIKDTSKNMNPQEEDWGFVGQHQVLESEFLRVMQIAFPPRGEQKPGAERAPRFPGRR